MSGANLQTGSSPVTPLRKLSFLAARLPPRPCASWGEKHAFTLLELMLAIAIGMIMLAVGVPAFVHAMKKEGLRLAVGNVLEACGQARSQAVLLGIPMDLVLNPAERKISVAAVNTPSENSAGGLFVEGGENPEKAPARPADFSREIPDTVSFRAIFANLIDSLDSTEVRVRFYPNGTTDEFAVVLSAENGDRQITLNVVTGVPEVEVLR